MSLPGRAFYKLYVSILVFLAIVMVGTTGYMVIEHYTLLEAVYMTVITLSTVGYAEVRPLSDGGRIFTIFLILANLGTFAYLISLLTRFFLDGEFIKTYKTYKMKDAISKLEGHVIICGFGRNGREAARIFNRGKRDFVVVEKEPFRKNDVSFPVNFYIEDDATRDEALLEAGIKNASALLATLPDDASNLFLVLSARELNPHIRIISRASNDSSLKKIQIAGATNVIMPDKIGGAHMANLVVSPDIKEFVDLMSTQNTEHFDITEVTSNKTATLEELDTWNKTGATVLGIKTANGEYQLNPIGKTVIRPGHRLIVMGSKEQIDKAAHLLS
ncbi:MAG: hypothetical protein JWO06_3965 [Bacteroidota bacterium]|nr:hypothetical protein [Bacteroidota bacterium]